MFRNPGSTRTSLCNSLCALVQGLRLHDNPALLAAAEGAQYLYPIFILDPHFLNPDRHGKSHPAPPQSAVGVLALLSLTLDWLLSFLALVR